LHQVRFWHSSCLCGRLRTFCTLGPARTSVSPIVPVLTRIVPRVLGAKRLGALFFCRSSVDLLYVLPLDSCFITCLILQVAPRLGLEVNQDAVNSVTRGLVGDTSFAVLPDVVPLTCFILTLVFQIVSYQSFWNTSRLMNESPS